MEPLATILIDRRDVWSRWKDLSPSEVWLPEGSPHLIYENAGGHTNDTPILPYLNPFPATQRQS